MKLASILSASALVAGSALLFSACAVTVDKSDKDDVAGETNAAALTDFKDLGEIPGTGEARTTKYANPPRYAAYTFYADAGDEIDVWVKGAKGSDDDAVAWVIDAKDKTLGFNDDATKTDRNAHITTKATTGTKAKYRVVFRDYYLAKGTFTVSVKVTPSLTKCSVDADCVKVKAGCCGTNYVAVNASRTDDVACKPPYPPCAPPPDEAPVDERVALCDVGTCKLVAPEAISCGGFTINPHSCPAGYSCVGDGLAYDAPGKCVKGCFYAGKSYKVGDTFKSEDGCNDCFCGESGGVGCTKRACAPKCDPTKEPNRKYVGTSKEKCMVIRYTCEAGTTGFANDCGCGCEQPADCPEWINCEPGSAETAKKCAALRAKCPYTPVAY